MHVLNGLMRIQLGLIVLIFAAFMFMAWHNAREKQLAAMENYLAVFQNQIDNHLTRITESLGELTYGNSDLELLRSDSEEERQYAAVRLTDDINTLMQNVDGADAIVIALEKNQISLGVKKQGVSLAEMNALRAFALEYAGEGAPTGNWQIFDSGGEIWLYRVLLYKNRAVIGFTSAKTLLSGIPSNMLEQQSFYLAETETETETDNGILYTVGSFNLTETGTHGRLKLETGLARGELSLGIGCSTGLIWHQLGSTALLMLVLLAVLLGFSLYFSRTIRKELLVPMADMTREMECIKGGQYDRRIDTRSDSAEFRTLVAAFNTLIGEIVQLKIRYYEKQLAFMDAEQKYIRLQIRPHFFLNAMTTIVGLSRAGDNQAIEKYIGALSKNIRYMFSSGLHTVPLADELRHVENYLEMQELKYPDAVLYFADVSEEAKQHPIPQMLIHTVIENEYKYALRDNDQLMLLLRARLTEDRELEIEIEDSGKGYPEDVIKGLNDPSYEPDNSGSRVGLWSCRRLLELMYDRQSLMELENVEPHGALTRFRIPETAHQEH